MQGIQSLHLTQPTGLLGIPLKIRLEIYRYSLIRRKPINLQFLNYRLYQSLHENYKPLNPKGHTVVLVSRQISEEALNVLYGENVFEITLHQGNQRFPSEFAPTNMQRIRRLQLFVRANISCGPPLKLNPYISPPILASLTRLYIVAWQPLEAKTFNNAPRLEREMHKWPTELKLVLEYVNQYVSSRATIEVDDNDMGETSELVKKCFPNGYRKVRTRTGDIWFERDVPS